MCSPVTPGVDGRVLDSVGMKSVVSRNASIVNSPDLSDVKFIFKNLSSSASTNGDGQGQGGETLIYGHKLILALASPVFRKMFYMDKNNQQFVTTDSSDEIHMNDRGFNAEAFLKFIRVLYTDKIHKKLSLQLIVGILSCADYYGVPSLKRYCAGQLEQILTKENVIRILETAEMFGERDLKEKALEFIDENLESLVESEEILCIKLETLFEILKRDFLDIDECFVLDLALKWAGKECERHNREPTGENKREVLGKVFFEIRFGLLTSDRISSLVSSNLLTRDESLDILLDVHTPRYVTADGHSYSKRRRLGPEVGFKSSPRIFGQKMKLMEVDQTEEKWEKKRTKKSLANGWADLIMRGFPKNMTKYELRDEIERAGSVFDIYVHNMYRNDGDFHVQFYYNTTEYDLSDLLDPAWYEFDNPRSIQISNWKDDNDEDDDVN